MKFRLIAAAAFFGSIYLAGCNPGPTGMPTDPVLSDTSGYTMVQWLDSVVHFGTINKGEKIKVAFRFRNTGNHPLLITNVRAGCGCTVPEYTKEAVKPGGEGLVTGEFDSNKAQAGEVRKSIFVTANTRNKSTHTLIFTGLIKEAGE